MVSVLVSVLISSGLYAPMIALIPLSSIFLVFWTADFVSQLFTMHFLSMPLKKDREKVQTTESITIGEIRKARTSSTFGTRSFPRSKKNLGNESPCACAFRSFCETVIRTLSAYWNLRNCQWRVDVLTDGWPIVVHELPFKTWGTCRKSPEDNTTCRPDALRLRVGYRTVWSTASLQ